ncbi:retrotransposon protein, putative, ty1-copia subclass [Tanacetum coccineum]
MATMISCQCLFRRKVAEDSHKVQEFRRLSSELREVVRMRDRYINELKLSKSYDEILESVEIMRRMFYLLSDTDTRRRTLPVSTRMLECGSDRDEFDRLFVQVAQYLGGISIQEDEIYRVDYEEMFSPIADIRAIRILIAIAVFYDYEIWQMDVKTAFLNGYIDEDIYMVQPEGFVDPKHPRKLVVFDSSCEILYIDVVIFVLWLVIVLDM